VTTRLLLDNSAWVRLADPALPTTERHDLGVLHYDHDYDLIVEKTDLAFDSVWLAARGTL
jgi:hypothetical protein